MTDLFEKYKIKSLDNFYEEDMNNGYNIIINILKGFTQNTIPNILMYGNPGSGKKTLIYSLFNNCKKVKLNQIYKKQNKDIEYILFKSNYFIELDLKDLGLYKKYILKDVIQQYISNKSITNNNKIIIIHNSDLLELNDQAMLRKIMEDNIKNSRFILISNTNDNLISPIESRCLILKTPGFTKEDVKRKCLKIIQNENFTIENNIIKNILDDAGTNMKKMILKLNMMNKHSSKIKNIKYHTNTIIQEIINIIKNKSSIGYDTLDEMINKLSLHCNQTVFDIINEFTKQLMIIVPDTQKKQIIDLNYNTMLKIINYPKDIIILQSYVLNLRKIIH